MNASELAEKLNFEILALPNGENHIDSCYTGDLLSWVMSHAHKNCAWVTIITSQNICAVGVLVDVGCIIIAENAEVSTDLIKLANNKEVNLFRSEHSAAKLCALIDKLLC